MEALEPVAGDVALLAASLGRMWSSDIDVLVRAAATDRASGLLADRGFLSLEPLLERLGRTTPGVVRFAAVQDDEVLGSAELCRCLYDYGPDATPAIDAAAPAADGGIPLVGAAHRLQRTAGKVIASRRLTVRAALELLAALERIGSVPSTGDVAAALDRAAGLGRRIGAADVFPDAPRRLTAADPRWLAARSRSAHRLAVERLRPRRMQVVFSGIDGAGKTTQVQRLAENLGRLNVPSSIVWVRLGFSGSALLSGSARLGQRLLPPRTHSAHPARASGLGEPNPLTRRGPIGWTWALANTLDYIRQARAAVRRGRGRVAIFDRSALDAAIALDHDYGGALALRLHHRILQAAVPRPDRTFYLRLPAAVAYARKDDMFSPSVLGALVDRYDRTFPGRAGVVELDAQRPAGELAVEVLRTLAGHGVLRDQPVAASITSE
ncbi:MAG: hypothetical protein E6G41_13090 [Actinobacteria bacterium]|nr:MAG: hypothetical protein E6G41_13090 [Actinomycetota bacterium]